MRKTFLFLGLAAAAVSSAQLDDITQRLMFPQQGSATTAPQWGTLMVGSESRFKHAGQYLIDSYDQWCQMWPIVSGPYYTDGMVVPTMIDWQREQILILSLGDYGVQGYGLYVEDIRRNGFGFDVSYVMTQPSLQVGVTFSYGSGTSPFVALRVPRGMGIPSYYSRWYTPSRRIIQRGCNCGHCQSHNNQIWVFSRGALTPYVPPGQQKDKDEDGH